MSHKILRFVQLCLFFLLLSSLESCGNALALSQFFGYPFGGSRDSRFPPEDDTSVFIGASVQFPYFHNFYSGISVDSNGHITFSDQLVGSAYSPRALESIGQPRVAPLWIDLDVRVGGNIYYRVLDSTMHNGQSILASISQLSSAFVDSSFNVKWALLVTWDHVPYYSDIERNAVFQLVVATDGLHSVIMFLYDEIMNGAVIGFVAGKTFYQMPMDQALRVQNGGNAGQAGLWIFRTDGGDSLTDVKGNIQFDCYQYSQATNVLQWYKDGIMLNDTASILGTSTNLLSVRNITGSDFGLYQCYVGDFYSKAALLTVSPTGSVGTSPETLLITAGDSLSINCSAEGGPDNIFQWNHNGIVLANHTTLNITAVVVESLGNYTCMVTNVAGSDSFTSTLHGFTALGPGGGLCSSYTKRLMDREVEVCLPTFSTNFAFAQLRHSVIVYSPSDQPINSEPSDHELLPYLFPRAHMNANANPHLLAIYEDTNHVPVSLTVDGLQPNTTYLIFIQVEMLHQGVVVTSYSSDIITVMTSAETSTVSLTMYITAVSAMGSVIAFMVLCAALLTTGLLCRMYYIHKQVVTASQPSSITETVQGDRYSAHMNAESGCVVEPNPAYHSVSYMEHSSYQETITEQVITAPMQLDGREGESRNVYENVKFTQ